MLQNLVKCLIKSQYWVLVPAVNKPLPKPMLTNISKANTISQDHNEFEIEWQNTRISWKVTNIDWQWKPFFHHAVNSFREFPT